MASADVEGAFDGIGHEDVNTCSLAEGRTSWNGLLISALFLISRAGSAYRVPLVSSEFLNARVTRQGSVEGSDLWNQVLDNSLREPASRWKTDGIGFRLATDYRRALKKRHGPSSDAVDNGGLVLHHLCWANDSYAMSGTMDRLTRKVKDMTSSIEWLGMQWKEGPHCCCGDIRRV